MMAKRKVGYKSALTNNNTPKESLSDAEFAAEYAGGEEPAKGANRNSKKGKQGN
ncbi:hypothetical protein [Priestia megaterium]|uniref:hypothetical protein n=1 Tax=Priestia megaterium TaxID=1404 RepID=UPI0005EA36FF|nr:hypothetical protein [Priestia megaterium]CJF67082.1 Uncharacterised protein [Streptococcus pneumoniae]